MTNKTTKRALLMSVLSMLLCFTMLIGTTFAWFTDEVTSTGNKIVSGKLDVQLFKETIDMDNLLTNPLVEEEITDSSAPLFSGDIIWEPGYAEVVNLKLKNNGNLALKWQAALRSTGEVGMLAEVIDVYVLYGEIINTANGRDHYADKVELVGTLEEIMNGDAILSGELKEADEVCFFSIVMKMQESAGNEYQEQTAGEFDIQILATQLAYENDSFDNQYDADASIDDAVLQYGGVIDLDGNVNDALNVAEGAKVTINMNEKTVNNTLTNNGEVTVNGGTIAVDNAGLINLGTATLTDVVVNAGSTVDYSNITRGADAETTYDSVIVNSAGGGVGAVDGASVTFNSGSVEVDSKSTSGRYLFYAEGQGSEIIINGGNFDFNKTQNQKRAYIYAGEGSTVYVNGGTFGKASTRSGYTAGILGDGEVIITGGTFGFNPSAWVAPGYIAVESNGTWTVTPAN